MKSQKTTIKVVFYPTAKNFTQITDMTCKNEKSSITSLIRLVESSKYHFLQSQNIIIESWFSLVKQKFSHTNHRHHLWKWEKFHNFFNTAAETSKYNFSKVKKQRFSPVKLIIFTSSNLDIDFFTSYIWSQKNDKMYFFSVIFLISSLGYD